MNYCFSKVLRVDLQALLDLSAAFDTVDHASLLRRPDVGYGIRGRALTGFILYLDGRHQYFRCDASKSAMKCVPFWSPSRIGPGTDSNSTLHC
jgi:hypothetical protein